MKQAETNSLGDNCDAPLTVQNNIEQVIEMLSNAHNLLAKSNLSMEDYSPISIKLASVKLELFELLKHKQ